MKIFLKLAIALVVLISPQILHAQTEHLVGKTSAEQIRQEHQLFDVYTKRYEPDSVSIQYLSQITDSIQIFAMFGTWCHDSKRHLPELMKTLELADNEFIQIEYLAVTKQKDDPQGIAKRMNLKNTPTFIIYKGNEEIGRIVEEPTQKLEEDLAKIIRSSLEADR